MSHILGPCLWNSRDTNKITLHPGQRSLRLSRLVFNKIAQVNKISLLPDQL